MIAMKFVTGLYNSIRNKGLRTTLRLAEIKVKSIVELFFPHTIWSESVGLRPVTSSLTDAQIEQVYKWSRDEETLRWTGGVPFELSLEEFREQKRRERWSLQFNQRLFYIVTKEDGIIGRVGLFTIDWERCEGEFGISLDKKYWDKRYGREATKMFIQYVFARTPIRRIYLGTYRENVRAQHSFIASGFRVTGTTSRFSPNENRHVDGIEMEVTAQDLKKD